mgnify:CR=1 FL=1
MSSTAQARAKGSVGQLQKFRTDPLAYLNYVALNVVPRIRDHEERNKTPRGARFEDHFNTLAEAKQAIAAALFKAVDPGMENGIPGNELITSRVLWFDKDRVKRRLENLMQIKSRVTGRTMHWGVNDQDSATVRPLPSSRSTRLQICD